MAGNATRLRLTLITLDRHLARAIGQAERQLRRTMPGLSLSIHAAADWEHDPASLASCLQDIASADIIIVAMIFLEDQVRAILPALQARQHECDAMAVIVSAPELVRLTRLGQLRMDKEARGLTALLRKLRGARGGNASSGQGQMAMLRRLPALLRLIPGSAQDLRAYFLTMQYWLAGSEDNVINMLRLLITRYADGPRRALRDGKRAAPPAQYPETGLYHPRMAGRISTDLASLPNAAAGGGRIGVLLLRSYVLARDTAHYDGVIAAIEAAGMQAVPAFAAGLDQRPAIEAFFMRDGVARVDAIVSLTGFSLVGGPAYNDSSAAADILRRLDVPYVAAQPVEFQSLRSWQASSTGLTPVEATMMVALPELDGAITPMVFGGRGSDDHGESAMCADPERIHRLAARLRRIVDLRRSARAARRVAVVLFNFPPNAGASGTAAYLAVFESLFNTLRAMAQAGYQVDVPPSVDALRQRILGGNAAAFGTDANVLAQISADDHVRRERHLDAIEREWGPGPGRVLSNGRAIFVLGAQFGNVLVGLQPGFGYEGDPMRLMFEGGAAPTHAFAAFYRYLRDDFAAHAVLHFGTHGALEFMPGKQVGLSGDCWPERLIGDVPNFYLYAANNPSEGAIAKRRGAATLISYLTPAVAQAGLYRGLAALREAIERWRLSNDAQAQRDQLYGMILAQAAALDLPPSAAGLEEAAYVAAIAAQLYEYETALIPEGLHVLGQAAGADAQLGLLAAMATAMGDDGGSIATATDVQGPAFQQALRMLADGASPAAAAAASGLKATPQRAQLFARLANAAGHLRQDSEMTALLHALDGGFTAPAPGGDLLRNPEILPTGRNLHGFDPFRIPSAAALQDGAAQAERLLARHLQESGRLPESVAFVLWGTDNLKSEGAPIGQVLALLGARPAFDSYGRLCGASLIPLAELGRPRIDVVITLSGIFRDILPLQTRLLAEAAYLAATADEPEAQNHVRRHALAQQAALGCDANTAALRVFSNSDGAYGANVNLMIDSGAWQSEDELADVFESRKCFAYDRRGKPARNPAMLGEALKTVEMAYQNLDSLELGITNIDHYVDTLGGIARAARRARGTGPAVYVGDQTQGRGKVRTLAEQVAFETRTRTLNPRWYDGLLRHGYEGVRQIEAQVTNTMGWSATTAQVEPWIYQKISETFVLDDAMRERLVALNPKASSRMAARLLEAHERQYWTPDAETLSALRRAGDDIEDRLEGIGAAD